MFKNKYYLTPSIILTIYNQKHSTIYYNDKFNNNLLNLKTNFFFNLPINYTTEFNTTQCSDIAGVDFLNSINTNNLFYNYKWDFYLNIINNKKFQKSITTYYNNRLWLEREVSEFFFINFYNLKDARNLLLNYNENIKYLLKNINVQTNFELKTSWHYRKLLKNKNINIEI